MIVLCINYLHYISASYYLLNSNKSLAYIREIRIVHDIGHSNPMECNIVEFKLMKQQRYAYTPQLVLIFRRAKHDHNIDIPLK